MDTAATHKLGSWKDRLKRFVRGYYTSLWIPSAVVMGAFVLGLVVLYWYPLAKFISLDYALPSWQLLLILAFVNLLVAAVLDFWQRAWIKGIIQCTVLLVGIPITLVELFAIGFNPPDHFGKDIVIPPGMSVSEPMMQSRSVREKGDDERLMPTDSIKRGKPELSVLEASQPGIYDVIAYANPGEPGEVYLKVFEATRNTSLSPEIIKLRSRARIEWSSDAETVFYYTSRITVYEGDWETFYPARFEVWFVPDSRGPERKLIERIYRIEGWQW